MHRQSTWRVAFYGRRLPVWSLIVAWCFGLQPVAAQNTTESDSAHITLQLNSSEANVRVELWEDALYYTPFQQAPIVASGSSDSRGVVELSLPVNSYRYSLSSPETGLVRLFLYPGQTLTIQAGKEGPDSVIFSGDYADDQILLNDISMFIRRNRPRLERNTQPVEFLEHLVNFRQSIEKEVDDHCKIFTCTAEFRSHLEAFADAHIAAQQRMADRDNVLAGRSDFTVEKVLQKNALQFQEVPELLELAVAPVMDSMFVRLETDPALELDQKGQARYKLNLIERWPDDFRRPSLYAAVLAQYFSLDGASGFGQQLLASYRDRVDPDALPLLQSLYDRAENLVGFEISDAEFLSPAGDPVRISDFRGNVLYMDVWATWCAPCFTQLPFARELEAFFADEAPDEVVFLNISVDDETNRWKSLIRDNPRFGGVQVINSEGWKGDFVDALYVIGLPRYVLVDRLGKIVLPYAPAPSSMEEIKSAIQALLR